MRYPIEATPVLAPVTSARQSGRVGAQAWNGCSGLGWGLSLPLAIHDLECPYVAASSHRQAGYVRRHVADSTTVPYSICSHAIETFGTLPETNSFEGQRG
jgi:hypothetical protein